MTLVSSAQPEMGARAAPGPDSESVILNPWKTIMLGPCGPS